VRALAAPWTGKPAGAERRDAPKSTPCKKTVCKELRNAGRVRSEDGVSCPATCQFDRFLDSVAEQNSAIATTEYPSRIHFSTISLHNLCREFRRPKKKGGNTMVTPLRAIRTYCLQCSGDSPSEVRFCSIADCPLFGYRLGKTGRTRILSAEQKQMLGIRLAKARESKQRMNRQ